MQKGDVIFCDNKHNFYRILADFQNRGISIIGNTEEYTITLLEDEDNSIPTDEEIARVRYYAEPNHKEIIDRMAECCEKLRRLEKWMEEMERRRMTDIKSAIEFLNKETYCQFNKGDCDLDCGVCEYNTDSYGYDGDTKKAIYDLAIRSLEAWEEVLQELKEVKEDAIVLMLKDDFYLGKVRGLAIAIDIINQHLAEVKE